MKYIGKRVAITGLAASTSLGVGIGPLFQRLGQGLYVSASDLKSESDKIAASKLLPEITNDISKLVRKTRTDNLLTRHLLAAVDDGIGRRLANLDDVQKARAGVVLGDCSGNVRPYFESYETATREGYEFVNPVNFPVTLLNYSTVQLNSAFSLRGSSTTIGSGFAAGLDALGYASAHLLNGKDRMIVAGGIEELNCYNRAFLEKNGDETPSGSIRPFQETSEGAVPGEAVGVLLLEALSSGAETKRENVAEIAGYGSAKGHMTLERSLLQQRAAKSIVRALKGAGVTVRDVDAIFPSANGTRNSDEFEAVVLERVFGSLMKRIPIYPLKSITGECFTASGPLQCMAAVYALTRAGSASTATDSGTGRPNRYRFLLPETIAPCRCALVYVFGLDLTYSAVVLKRLSEH